MHRYISDAFVNFGEISWVLTLKFISKFAIFENEKENTRNRLLKRRIKEY